MDLHQRLDKMEVPVDVFCTKEGLIIAIGLLKRST